MGNPNQENAQSSDVVVERSNAPPAAAFSNEMPPAARQEETHGPPPSASASGGYVGGAPGVASVATVPPMTNAVAMAPVSSVASLVAMPRAFTLHIKRGKDLYNTDWMKPFSKLDPFVNVVMGGSQKCQTQVMKNIGVNPEFNFSHPMSWGGEPSIDFVVMDKDTFTSDDLVGQASLDMRAVQNGWSGMVNLVREGGKPAGTLDVEFTWQQPLPAQVATEVSRGCFDNIPVQSAAVYAEGTSSGMSTGMKVGLGVAAVGVLAVGALAYSASSGGKKDKKGGKDKKDKKGGKDKKDKKGKKDKKSSGPGMGTAALGVAGLAAAGGAAYYAHQQGMFGERGLEGQEGFQDRGLVVGGADSSSDSSSSDEGHH